MGWLLRFLLGERDDSDGPELPSSGSGGWQTKPDAGGSVDGTHYTGYVETVKQLKRERRHDEAIELLLKLVEATEKEAKKAGWGVAPWYYEQLAIVYRKERRYAEEVAILERYDSQEKAPGAKPKKLADRLKKARILRDKNRV